MTEFVRYLTHPQVQINPSISVGSWSLNEVGRERTQAFALLSGLELTKVIVCSAERKAVETAEIVANVLGLEIDVRDGMRENDRTSTGFLPQPEFERMADQFFARPSKSVNGWERAVDAQSRIVRAMEKVLAQNINGDILVVGHGAVGTLLLCHYSHVAINRNHDQPAGGGCYFTFEKASRRVLHVWRRMEDLTPD